MIPEEFYISTPPKSSRKQLDLKLKKLIKYVYSHRMFILNNPISNGHFSSLSNRLFAAKINEFVGISDKQWSIVQIHPPLFLFVGLKVGNYKTSECVKSRNLLLEKKPTSGKFGA